ncbi:MAG: hypothetical protein J5959_04825 [Butyrivibrio sp.]|nr:hypothetical protein [Butyrivibrio sp.]
MKNRGIGFILTLVACALALVDIIVYTQVMYTLPVIFVFLAGVIVIEGAAFFINNRILNNLLPVILAVLLGASAAGSFYVMVNQLGYVVAALDTVDTIISFIVFVSIAVAAMIIRWISGFMKQEKE